MSCQKDELNPVPNDTSSITPRACQGNWAEFHFAKGKCRNGCDRGLSIRCGGYVLYCRSGTLSISIPTCDENFSSNPQWQTMAALTTSDTASAVLVRLEINSTSQARFVFLEDIDTDLASDSDFTISNNVKYYDNTGYTFGFQTYHTFQFIGGDYAITKSLSYPYGSVLVSISSS